MIIIEVLLGYTDESVTCEMMNKNVAIEVVKTELDEMSDQYLVTYIVEIVQGI